MRLTNSELQVYKPFQAEFSKQPDYNNQGIVSGPSHQQRPAEQSHTFPEDLGHEEENNQDDGK